MKLKLSLKSGPPRGAAWDCEDPTRESQPLVESAIILRVLPDASLHQIQSAVESGDLSGISICWRDKRRAIVEIGSFLYAAKLIDLPTVIDVHKSLDSKDLYKTVDVCQMLLVVKKINSAKELSSLNVDKYYGETHVDGITFAMSNVKKRFTKKYQQKVVQNVEEEVERLLKLDKEAESSSYEFIDGDVNIESIMDSKVKEKKQKKSKKTEIKKIAINFKGGSISTKNSISNTSSGVASSKNNTSFASGGNVNFKKNDNDDDIDLDAELDNLLENVDEIVQGGDADEDEEDEDEDEDDSESENEQNDDNDNSGEQDNTAMRNNEEQQSSSDEDNDNGLFGDDDDDDDDDEDDYGINSKQHNAILLEEISELEATIEQKKRDVVKTVNPIMKNRISDVISRLENELEAKRDLLPKEPVKGVSGNNNSDDDDDDDDDDDEQGEEEEEEEEDNDDNDNIVNDDINDDVVEGDVGENDDNDDENENYSNHASDNALDKQHQIGGDDLLGMGDVDVDVDVDLDVDLDVNVDIDVDLSDDAFNDLF
ncbi:TATA-binding protein-associated factor [Martiniozyma asiatica (nom. inval.)]|nr:TATA-binding protein-associated factor [Martiniozyma asiatica]